MGGMTPSPTRRSPFTRETRTRYPLSEIDAGERVLQVVGSLRFATAIQLRRAVFAPISATPRQARYRATRSLRRLFDSGYLNRVQVFAPSAASGRLSPQVVQTLSAAGARAIGLDPRLARTRAPKADSVLSHDFWLVELGVLALEGCPEGLTVSHWWNDRVLAARKRKGQLTLPTIPDALLVARNIASGKDYPCLVELDLGTESVTARQSGRSDVARKIEGFLGYLGTSFRAEFALDAPPIVLIVADSDRRLASLRETTKHLGGGGRYWFATLPRLRGLEGPDTPPNAPPARLQAPFWASNWLTAANDQPRSLASRCGAENALG